MIESVKEKLGPILLSKTGLQILDVSATDQQVRFLARQPQARIGDLVLVIQALLLAAQSSNWKLDISKSYFLRGDKVVQAFRFILQFPEGAGEAALQEMGDTISSCARAMVEVTEITLPGAGPNRNSPEAKRGKGAHAHGSFTPGRLSR